MFLMTWMFFLSSPGEYAAFPDSTSVSCSGCFFFRVNKGKVKFLFYGMYISTVGQTTEESNLHRNCWKYDLLSGKLLSRCFGNFFENFNCKSNTTSQYLEEFFRFALPESFRSLNCLANQVKLRYTWKPEVWWWDTLLGLVSYFAL